MNEKNNVVLSCVGLVAIIVGTIVIGSIANGYTLSLLWKWFVVPVFDIPVLSVVQAIGFGMVITFLTRHSTSSGDKAKDIYEAAGEMLGNAILYPVLVIALGYIVTLFL